LVKGFHVLSKARVGSLSAGATFLFLFLAFQNTGVVPAAGQNTLVLDDNQSAASLALSGDVSEAAHRDTLDLHASATLTTEQVSQPEVIFLFSFPLPAGEQRFLGLKGNVSLTSQKALFNESLDTVATNTSGACPPDGINFPNYTSVYNAYPNLQPLQSFILKNPDKGVSKVAIDYTMPVGLPISDCMVVMLDWEGSSKVRMRSDLTLIYSTDSSSPAGMLLPTNQEFVFGIYIGPGSTKNDALSFVQETKISQPGRLLAFVGDVSDSTFYIPPPPGLWRTTNDIYLVPGHCPSDIPVNSGGWTPNGGHYYSDIPSDAQHLLSVPLRGYQAMVAQTFVYKTHDVKVERGDCLLTLFGLKAPKGGIDSENQVKALFLPSQ
jgi:hypothetical protein